ncbi:carbon-nitrogen hydrolase family protein [Eleftheria terrae]|uniref:carbon-nitrogen hydrolase family protein n=1 Tax=Eleftheria terrae TaxID=1597781 RepID=UPI00263BC39A|nr:carbon-nitrogen hydrolase family protein [Eleftheria terrae]WKB50931.1 carbon-nitrogen hydrolase family protein [Eleftheria terrae]
MKIAAVQMVTSCSLPDNLATARELIARAAAEGAELVALPENFAFMGRDDRDKLPLAEPLGQGPAQAMLSAAAREHGVWLIGGSIAIATEDPQRVGNTTLVYDPRGERVARYDKIHLFRYQEPASGEGRGRLYDEAVVLKAGDRPVAFEATDNGGSPWRVGLSICYDLRFPELYRQLTRPACDLLVVPSAFTWTTGRAHWELLLRARAVENQCYVMAPAQGGIHENGRRTWGHSLIVDPWGEVVAVQAEGAGLATASLSRERLLQVRAQLPALAHRQLG